jgi:hypothetical protein
MNTIETEIDNDTEKVLHRTYLVCLDDKLIEEKMIIFFLSLLNFHLWYPQAQTLKLFQW